MHIAFLTPEFPTEANFDGGLANYLARTSVALEGRGHDVEVFVSSEGSGSLTFDGVLVHRVPSRLNWLDGKRVKVGVRFGRRAPAKAEVRALALARALRARHSVAPFDVVQASNFGAVGLCVGRWRSFPLVTRCSYYPPYWWAADERPLTDDLREYHEIETRAVANSDRVYAPSFWLSDVFRREQNFEVDVIESTFFLDGGRPTSWRVPDVLAGKRYLLYFGTLARYKGVHLLAEALPRVLEAHPDLVVALAGKVQKFGEGSMLEHVLGRCGDVCDRVHYLGVLPHGDLYPVIANASVVVFPSLAENLSNACMEALALSRVVVASADVSFEQLIVPGESGFLSAYGDAEALAGALDAALRLSPEAADRMGEAARASVARLAPERTLPLLERFFMDAIASRRRSLGSLLAR